MNEVTRDVVVWACLVTFLRLLEKYGRGTRAPRAARRFQASLVDGELPSV